MKAEISGEKLFSYRRFRYFSCSCFFVIQASGISSDEKLLHLSRSS